VKKNPFHSDLAVQNSSLYLAQNGRLAPFDSSAARTDLFLFETHNAFRNLVMQPNFSCLGAKAAINNEAYGFAVYDQLGAEKSATGLARDLYHFTQSGIMRRSEYATFIAVFRTPRDLNEIQFEQLLWRQLRQLHRMDSRHFEWDSRASFDPRDPCFSFSFAGQAFYIVGMHGHSSRAARRFSWPTLVFNPHEQFEKLRTDGKWKRMQQIIRAREIALQGSVNPMLSDFGAESEARQYSGRSVEEDWTAPFPFADDEAEERLTSALRKSNVSRRDSRNATGSVPPGQGGKCPFAN
jgi:uncharacterized protein